MKLECLPQKTELFYLIPALRKELVLVLMKKGLSGKEAAAMLCITKAAVSQYGHFKRARGIKFPSEIKKEIEKSAELIFKGKDKKIASTREIVRLLDIIRETHYICEVCKEECACR